MTAEHDSAPALLAGLHRWRLLLGAPIAAAVLAYGASFLVTPVFTARSTLLPPQQQQSQSMAVAALASLGSLGALAGGVRTPADQYVALMLSTTATDRLIDKFDLMKAYEAEFRVDARRALAKATRISIGKRDGLITIEVDDHDPQRAAALTNAYVDELRALTTTLAISEAQQRRQFFESLLKSTREQLERAQQALQGSGFDPGALRVEPRAAADEYARLKAEVTATEVRLQALSGRLAPGAAEVRQAQATLDALRAKLRQQEAASASRNPSDYIGRYRDYKYQEVLFEMFARQYELARVDESREGPLVQVIDAATPPERRSWPRRGLTALVGGLGTAAILVLVLLLPRTRRQL